MAGDWIKMRSNLHEDPRVVQIAAELSADEIHVVGMLWRAWSWADGQTLDGNAVSVTETFLDRIVRRDGFSVVLRKVGWLEGRNGALTFPRFAEHNGQTAKSRAVTQKRVAAHRNASSVTDVTLPPLPEKRREEKKIKQPGGEEVLARKLLHSQLFDGLARVCGIDPAQLTKSGAASLATALAEIRTAFPSVTIEEIHRRSEAYRKLFPGISVTPFGVAKHWAACVPGTTTPIRLGQNLTE